MCFQMKIVRENINEGRLTDVKPTDIINKDLEELFFDDYYTMTVKLAEYCQENYIECDFEDEKHITEIKNSKDFKNYMKYELEYRFEETVNSLHGYIKNGMINVWRIISVKPDWLDHLQKQGQRLGIYWSYQKDAAEAHWGYKSKERPHYALIQVSVKEEHIDWISTVEANIRPDTGEEEKEITLFKNTPIKISAIWIDDEPQDISKIKDKTFKA